jgi:hypothetical protein
MHLHVMEKNPSTYMYFRTDKKFTSQINFFQHFVSLVNVHREGVRFQGIYLKGVSKRYDLHEMTKSLDNLVKQEFGGVCGYDWG